MTPPSSATFSAMASADAITFSEMGTNKCGCVVERPVVGDELVCNEKPFVPGSSYRCETKTVNVLGEQ